MKCFSRIFGVLVAATLVSATAQANIMIDEDFEGAAAFVDRDWPVKGESTQPTPAIVGVKGICLRCWDSTAGSLGPKPLVFNTGSIVSTRHFTGAKSLQLDSGQACGFQPVFWTNCTSGGNKCRQFAIAADSSVASLPAGTVIGHYKSDWSTTDTVSAAVSFTLQFRVSASKKVEIFCVNTSSVVGNFDPGQGSWALISLLIDHHPTENTKWLAYDPLTTQWKGPVTGTEVVGDNTKAPTLLSGIHVFLNSNTEAQAVTHPQVGTGWGNDGLDVPADTYNSGELGWEIRALNGGKLYVDNFFMSQSLMDSYTGWNNEVGARLQPFTQATNEPPPTQTAASDWQLLQ